MYLSLWETGHSMPDVSLFDPLCQMLEISIPELLAGHPIVEAGRGENSLPLGQFDEIFERNLGILTLGLALA